MDYKRIVDQQAQTIQEFENAYKTIVEESTDAESALTNLIALALTLRAQKEAYEKVEEAVRATVKEIMVDELAIDTFETNVGNAVIRAGSESPDYDDKALETLVISDKELAERLLPFRKLRTRQPSLVISTRR